MINLLPEDAKKEILAARSNVTLLNYMLILGLGVAFLVLISVGVYVVITTTKTNAETLIKTNQAKSTSYSSVRAQGNSLRSSLSSAKTILDKEIDYTKVITAIAAAMPSGVVLDSLSLTPSAFGGPATLQFFAKTTADALALKDKFQASSLFSDVNFQSLSTSQGSDYPVSASINLIINKEASK